jgi:hypothetical protein
MGWVSLALALLKFVNSIMTWARERELVSEGYDKAIAEQSEAILRKTYAGKAILERVNALSDDDVDAELRGLEPK